MIKTSFFRRPSDTLASAILRWLFLVLSAVGLLAFAVDRIQRVIERDATVQRKDRFRVGSFATDYVFITRNATLTRQDTRYKLIPATVHSPYLGQEYDTMFFFYENIRKPIKEYGTSFSEFAFETNIGVPFGLITVVRGFDPYHQTTPSTVEEYFRKEEWMKGRVLNLTDEVQAYIKIDFLVAKEVRRDFWGLFSMYDKPFVVPSQTLDRSNNVDTGRRRYVLSESSIEYQEEVLLMSIPDALASWGGVFSLVLSIFHFLFGTGQMSPLGFLQKRLMESSTIARIRKVYGNRNKDSVVSNDDNNSSSQGHDTNTQDSSHHEKSPLLDIPNDNSSDQEEPSQKKDDHKEDLAEVNGLKQRIQRQEDDLDSLRASLKKHEQRSEILESLIKDLYLDMEIVNTVILDMDDSSSTSTSDPPAKKWFQRLPWSKSANASTENKED